ncbi:MAG: DEAD/DEAH box helicase family protein [Solirubrobacteraceae bacterium]
MRFTLKDYQSDAAGEVLRNLTDARDDWHRKRRPVAFSLTATTGAGKTVMAAAVIEALFEGNDDFDFEADTGSVVLWFTDDPSLNEQTRFRLMEAGDRIPRSRLVVIENTFNQAKLEAGRVYFLNAQKLSKNSLLVKGEAMGSDQLILVDHEVSPDLRAFTMWDTLRNTIEDERLTLYVVLDEAHRGMKPASKTDRAEKQTIVKRLVNGANGVRRSPWCGASPRRSSGSTRRWPRRRGGRRTRRWWLTLHGCRSPGCSRTTSAWTSRRRAVGSTRCCSSAPRGR